MAKNNMPVVSFLFTLIVVVFLFSHSVHCNRNRNYAASSFLSSYDAQEVGLSKGSPWPLPRIFQPSSEIYFLDKLKFEFVPRSYKCDLMIDAFNRYYKLIFDLNDVSSANSPNSRLIFKSHKIRNEQMSSYNNILNVILMNPCENAITLKSDESYVLNVDTKNSYLEAKSIWGILRGLETFSQLVYVQNSQFAVNRTYIKDQPRFSWRGVLLDSSRHFLPVQTILKFLDAMAYNKMNVFHWHIVDDQSFPFQSVFPRLSQMGAYRPYTHVYSRQDVAQILEYARVRGVRVVPEFDTPVLGKGQMYLLTQCFSGNQPNGNFGPIDPSRNENFNFLQEFFKDVASAFPDSNAQQKSLVLGGEACLWGEYVDSTNVHSRLWPSASAVAERLWSDESVRDIADADRRLREHRCRMLRRGIMAEPGTGPGFCEEEMVL
ncbi:hypothetical protein HELRODRAFT_192733 [Helobdella robusta]|uniref:beta-N-acetylhexosaminidase n=1 Tax=Helobdella robusta TaxID=6412 RepID=T1FU87_HELRO|nr:hypothetical protein HELRODRAFT_192733 [Helobdella robusta]ESO00103.1 hypothetical protein HELRODRAFT_192733 [Helobdella robusta]